MGCVPRSMEETRENAPREVVAAAALTGLEGLALIGIGILLAVKTATSHPNSVLGALLGALIAVVAGGCLIALTRPLLRCRRWSRTPIVVLNVLWLPVGFSLAFQAGLPGYGAPLLVVALAVLILFGTPAGRGAFDNEE
jgi:peptidoglycan/LPS O-acetylase OafA/YrhL